MWLPTFEDFLDENKFSTYKYFFLVNDDKYLHELERDIIVNVDMTKNDITIVKKNITKEMLKYFVDSYPLLEGQFNQDKIIINFYKDCLTPSIAKMFESYKKSFIQELDNRNIFENSGIENFSRQYLKKLDDYRFRLFRENTFLKLDIIEKVIQVIDKLYEFVSIEFYQEKFYLKQKIPLNINKNQIVVLFHFFYENGIISESEIKPTDLSRLIEHCFTYYDKESNSFKEIKRARDLELRIFNQDEEPSPEPSIQYLQDIFTNPKFFDY